MTGVIGWGTRDWIGEVEDWIGEVVGQRCRLVHRETRPWSTLWTVSTGAETLWFKANCPAQRSEAGVHAALARLVPDYVDAPVAVEPARGWLLTREGGTPLNHCSPNGSGDVGLATLTAVVRDYAALQRGTVGCGDQLVSAGLSRSRERCIAGGQQTRSGGGVRATERPYLGLSTRTVARAVRVVGTVGSVGDAGPFGCPTRRTNRHSATSGPSCRHARVVSRLSRLSGGGGVSR